MLPVPARRVQTNAVGSKFAQLRLRASCQNRLGVGRARYGELPLSVSPLNKQLELQASTQAALAWHPVPLPHLDGVEAVAAHLLGTCVRRGTCTPRHAHSRP